MIYFLTIPMTFLGALGAYFFKLTATKAAGILSFFKQKELYFGGFLYVSAAVLNVILLRYLQYSILYPMTALTYIWTAILSYNLLGERITKQKFFGILIIFIGVIFLTE